MQPPALSPFRRLLGVILAFLAAAPVLAAEEEATSIGGVDAVVWTTSRATSGEQPVVVFSHAMHMCPTQSRYLMRALADAGYVVIAPRHLDSNCALSIPQFNRFGWKPSRSREGAGRYDARSKQAPGGDGSAPRRGAGREDHPTDEPHARG